MTSTNPSSVPVDDNKEEVKAKIETDERHIPLRNRNKSQIILERKLRNLQEFANAYNLNLSSIDDTLLRTDEARESVQRMANDVLTSIDEANQINFGSFVAQMGGYNRGNLARSRMQTFYQELLDVMPSKWKEIFQQQST
jgi:hypothetical protein